MTRKEIIKRICEILDTIHNVDENWKDHTYSMKELKTNKGNYHGSIAIENALELISDIEWDMWHYRNIENLGTELISLLKELEKIGEKGVTDVPDELLYETEWRIDLGLTK